MSQLAPFLADILRRHPSTSTLRGAAAAAGVSHVAIGEVLRGRAGAVAIDKLELAATAAGATAEELVQLRALAAIDRGALPIPPDADEARVRAALAIIEGRA